MIDFTTLITWLPRIAGALSLVAISIGISRWQKLALERNMLIAVTRAFIQLLLIGYALELIFSADNPIWMILIISVMVSVAGLTAGDRGKGIANSKLIATASVAISVLLTLGSLLVLRVFDIEARFVIPIAGMITGNAMTATGLAMARLRDDLKANRLEIETALALGANSRQAVAKFLRQSLATGMTPIIDSTKTVGLIALPGAMTGMILAGASPIEAVQLQIVVMYMLIGAAAFASLSSSFLAYRNMFTKQHQLKPLSQEKK